MAKPKGPKVPPPPDPAENHLQVFARLSRVVNMHGHPGMRKPKGGK